jgi:hypothetical protein
VGGGEGRVGRRRGGGTGGMDGLAVDGGNRKRKGERETKIKENRKREEERKGKEKEGRKNEMVVVNY